MTNKHIELPAPDSYSRNASPGFDEKDVYSKEAVLAAIASHEQARVVGEPVAWCELTQAGTISYFDGKPMIMCGPVGNEHHPHALYLASPPAPQEAQADEQAVFEAWLARERPSGDADQVGRQWLASGDYEDFHAAPVAQPASVTTTAHAIHEALNPGAPVEWPLEDEEQPATAQAEAPGEREILVAKLQACADDPMWANHAEISKRTLRQAIVAINNKPPENKACTTCGGSDWLPGCFTDYVRSLCLTCLGKDQRIAAQDVVPILLWERVVEEFAGLLQQVEVFCSKHGEADFEIGNALKVIGEAVDFEGKREATQPTASNAGEREVLLSELLRRARPYVDEAARRFYDGTGGRGNRENAQRLLGQIDSAALASKPTASAAAPWDECVASGQSCAYGPHGPNGEQQCRYCGSEPTASNAGERETFEAWARKEGFTGLGRNADRYNGTRVSDAWEGWQARTALASEPPQRGQKPVEWGAPTPLENLVRGLQTFDPTTPIANAPHPEPVAPPAREVNQK